MSVNEYPMPLLRPEVERDGYGRYVLPNPDEPGSVKSYTRATTMAGAIADKWNITQWQRRMIVEGLATKPELLNAVDLDLDQRDLKTNLTKVADDAHDAAGGNDASARGTTLHYYTEAVDGGHLTIDEVPPEYRNEVRAYVETMAKAGITIPPNMIERILLNLTVNVAGTADRQHVIMPNGTRLMADVKTGKDLSWSFGEIAMQLAIYAHAEFMLDYDADGTPYWDGVPEVDQRYALVMHVPVDQKKCVLYLVDIAAGWAAVELALDVREYRGRRNLARPLDINAWLPEGKTLADVALDAPATPEEPAPAGFDPFAKAPGDEAEAADLTPVDEARREYEATKAEIAEAKAAWPKGKRRTKAMIEAERADDEAQTNPDGVHTVQSYGILTRKLRRGFKLDEVPMTAPPPEGPSNPAPVEELPAAECTTPVTKYGTPVPKGDPRKIECTETIDRADPTGEAMTGVYNDYSDVWEQFHTDRAQDRIGNSANEIGDNATPEVVESETFDPRLKQALDACMDAEQMGTVYAQWTEAFGPDSWQDSYTEYGQSVLASR